MSNTAPPDASNPLDITTILKKQIEDDSIACTFESTHGRVLPEQVIAQIAALQNVNKYIEQDNDIQKLDIREPAKFATALVAHAPKLFILTVANNYPITFLHDMVMKRGYTDSHLPLQEGFEVANEFVEDGTQRSIIEHQALVCAPVFQKDKFDYKVPHGALPFKTAKECDRLLKVYFRDPPADAIWKVELVDEFDEHLAERCYILARFRSEPERKQAALAGFWYEGEYYLLL